MFEKIFDEIVEKNSSVKMIGLWGKDGLVLERKSYRDDDLDKDMVGAEVAEVLSGISKMSYAGDETHIRLETKDSYIFIFTISRDYFIIVVTEKDIIFGKLLFYIKLKERELFSFL